MTHVDAHTNLTATPLWLFTIPRAETYFVLCAVVVTRGVRFCVLLLREH